MEMFIIFQSILVAFVALLALGSHFMSWIYKEAVSDKIRGLSLINGSVRSMLALLIIGTYLNFAVFGYSMLFGMIPMDQATTDADIVMVTGMHAQHIERVYTLLLSALTGLVGAVMGVYFGARAATSPSSPGTASSVAETEGNNGGMTPSSSESPGTASPTAEMAGNNGGMTPSSSESPGTASPVAETEGNNGGRIASLSESPESIAGRNFKVNEQDLLEVCAVFKGYKYGSDKEGKKIHYPHEIPHARKELSGNNNSKKYIDCSTFLEALLVKCWLVAYDKKGFDWTKEYHADMLVYDGKSKKGRSSPITAAISSGMAKGEVIKLAENPDYRPEPWMIVQGWKGDGSKFGHAFLIWKVEDTNSEDPKILTLEASPNIMAVRGGKVNGVGFRGIGKIDGYIDDDIEGGIVIEPSNWKENKQVKRWGYFKDTWPEMYLAKLNVG